MNKERIERLVSYLITQNNMILISLTVGALEGTWLGFREGDWLGLEEGCETNGTMKRDEEKI